MKRYSLTFLALNKPGILYRITGIFLRHKINVERLEAKPSDVPGISGASFVIEADLQKMTKILQQVKKIIEVTNAEIKELE
jgi:acetolactate synthase I/III small subunit